MVLTIACSHLPRAFSKQPFLKQLTPCFIAPSANITSKVFREQKPKPPPYDYKNKTYPLWYSMLFDRTTSRFDENTKLIVVEGPIASGKTELAKALAEELDMYHIPEANMDLRYINHIGYDMRNLDDQLPESVKCYDEKTFCKNPFGINSSAFQIWMYQLRFSRYVDALAHLLSTGQGVVTERCPYSDMVFMNAMAKNNFISKNAMYVYNEVKRSTLHQLLRPHLVIYLDMPVAKVKENIKKRNRDYEVNSKALTDAYLQDIEDNYKTVYLPEISSHAELLIYDWSDGGDPEVVVEDIERIDFDQYTQYDKKLKDWYKGKENIWAEHRRRYSDEKDWIMALFNVPALDAPELIVPTEDMNVYNKVWKSAPGMQYDEGFDPARDTGLLFKTKGSKYVPY